MRRESVGHLPFTKLWILYSVFCSATGWILSGLHFLNETGWLISLVIFVLLLSRLPGLQPLSPLQQLNTRFLRAMWLRRFRRPLPLCFLATVILVFLRCFANPGLFEGNDVYSYRIPRVLHWIHDQGWTWIPSLDARMNNRGCEFEWMELPFLMFDRSDRLIPLLTAIPFCLLPGLTFVTLRCLKINSRVAWSWCWLLPSTFCILIQAGTASTDGVGVFYALAAVGLALEAQRRSDVSYLYYGILSAALLINLKASNIPLLLPIGVALWLGRGLLQQRLAITTAVLLLATLASFLPIALANILHLHDWTGMAGETMIYKPANPFVAFCFNAVLVLAYLVVPPIIPISQHAPNIFDPLHGTFLWNTLTTQFEENYGMIRRRRDEDISGPGLGLALLLLPFVWSFLFDRSKGKAKSDRTAQFVDASTWIALFVTMAKSTLFALPRVLAPYYALLLVPFLRAPKASRIVRAQWWNYLGVIQFGVSLGMVLISTTSPPWPLSSIPKLQPTLLKIGFKPSFISTYMAERTTIESYRSVATQLPPDKEIGLIRHWALPESFFWAPYGSRILSHVLPGDTRESLLQRGIHHILVGPRIDLPSTQEKFHASVVRDIFYQDPVTAETVHFYLLELDAP